MTDETPIETVGELQITGDDQPATVTVDGDFERAILSIETDGITQLVSLFPEDIERLRVDLDAAAEQIDPEAAKQAQANLDTSGATDAE